MKPSSFASFGHTFDIMTTKRIHTLVSTMCPAVHSCMHNLSIVWYVICVSVNPFVNFLGFENISYHCFEFHMSLNSHSTKQIITEDFKLLAKT